MLAHLKSLARAAAPSPVKAAWGQVYGDMKIRRARKAFETANPSPGPSFLPADRLPALIGRGFRPPDPIRYDPDGLVLRADEKVEQLAARVSLDRGAVAIELGCWDGIVLAALRRRGLTAHGLDRSRDGFDARARDAGASLVQSDASRLALRSASVDLMYSFAAFEHFADPAGVVAEACRVLRPGGYLFLCFGPVYTSPYGRHAYRQVPIPYCHYLFAEADLQAYCVGDSHGGAWPYVNGVTVTAYRELWARFASHFERLYYREHPSGGVGAELIAEYPSCFAGKVPAFDDLLVSAIEICLRKR